MTDKVLLETLYKNFTRDVEERGEYWGDDHDFFAIADYVLYGDVDSYLEHMKTRSRIGRDGVLRRVNKENSKGEKDDFLTMSLLLPRVLNALAAREFDLATEIAKMMGGRLKAEKREHVFSRTLGYAIKATVLQSGDLPQRLADFHKTLTRKDTGVSYQGYGQLLNMMADPSVQDVTPALEHIAKYHKRLGDVVTEKALCQWGIGLANLAIKRGKTVTIDTDVIPADLLYKV